MKPSKKLKLDDITDIKIGNSRIILVDDTLSHTVHKELLSSILKFHKVIYSETSFKLSMSNIVKIAWINENINKDMVFLDIGACCGYFSIILNNYLSEGLIIAIEPEPENYKRLLSLSEHLSSTFTIINCAISDKKGTILLYVSRDAERHSVIDKHEDTIDTIKVETYSIDDITENLKRVDFIKIDVEGCDEVTLKGAELTLSKNKDMAVMMEVHMDRFNVDGDYVFNFFKNKNFRVYDILDSLKEITDANNMSEEILALKGKFNEKIDSNQSR